jgi:DNA processing protein
LARQSTAYWLALTSIDGLGVRGALKLVERFGSAPAVFEAPLAELEGSGLSGPVARAISAKVGLERAEKEIAAANQAGCRLLTLEDRDYPPLLRQLPDAPLVLYVRGRVEALSRHGVAIVGTRRPTAYGSSVAHRLAQELAQRNLVIVSGMARGIDSAAHRGALEARGVTVAVLGSGIDVIYPKENQSLAERIIESGALVSEFPLGTAPVPENFPIRNRLISGLALGTVIVEAAEYSGSLITARLAAEQNREVYAVPGNITSAQSFGPNLLIKQGAKLVDRWSDIIEELPASIRAELLPAPEPAGASSKAARAPLLVLAESRPNGLSDDQRAVYDALPADRPAFIDSIAASVRLPPPRILTALLELEMSGLVRQLPGKNFVRNL